MKGACVDTLPVGWQCQAGMSFSCLETVCSTSHSLGFPATTERQNLVSLCQSKN